MSINTNNKITSPVPQIVEINDLIGEKCDLDLEIVHIPFNNFDKAKTSSKTMGNIKGYGANTYQGLVRNYNEDRVSIIINMTKPENYTKKNWPKISFFGIYDGHGGSKCADFLRDTLHKIIFSNEYFPENAEKAIKKLPGGFSLMQDRELPGRMEALLGKDNVRVVEKGIEKRRKML